MVAFPEVKLKHMLVRNPFQSTLRGIDQLASEIVCGKDENIPVIAFELGEHQQAAQFWAVDRQARLFTHFPDHTLLWCFARLEFSAQPIPLAFMDVIGFFVAMFQI